MATNRPTTAPTQPTDSVARPVPPPVELSRCFICLDDDDDAPELANEWVFPSKCSLAAHQSCMLAWVRNRELENQPLNCPVCLEPISLVQQSDVLVSIADKFTGIISHVAPRALVTMILGGTITGMALYGAGAVWVFAGKDALAECIKTTGGGAVFLRWRRVMALPCVGPMLILGYTLPPVPVPLSVPLLAIYSSFLVGFDPGTFSWPPSAATAFVALPYFQTAYSSLYQALFQNYEDDLDRRLNGLPPALIDGPVNPAPVAAPAPAPAPAPAQNGDAQQDRQNGDDEIDEVGRLQGLLRDMRNALTFIQNVNVEAEIIEEPVFEEEEEPQVEVAAADRRTAQQDMDRRILAAMDWENANVLDIEDPWADGPVARPDSPYEGGRPAPVPVVEAPAPAPVAAAPAPVAPAQPARAPAAAPGRPNVQIELELNEPVEIPPRCAWTTS